MEILYKYSIETPVYEYEALKIYVSYGCGPCSFWRTTSDVNLSWAEGGTAMFIGDDADSTALVFYEPLDHFQYCVFSDEPLSTMLNVLESMD